MTHPTRLPRPWPVVAALLALLGSFGAFVRAEDGKSGGEPPEGTTKEFPDHNFKWTVPPKWEISDPSDDDKGAGFVAVAKRVVSQGVTATAYVLVRDSGGASVEGNLQQVRDNKVKKLTDVDAKIEACAWSGAEQAHVLKLLGKAENKSVVASLVYGGIVEGKYHQLDIKSVNGANHQIEAEIAAVAKGYRFLAGAKAEDEPQPPAPGDGQPAPAEANKKRFEKLGLTWTLPAAPPPEEPPPGTEGKEPAKFEAGWSNEGNANLGPLESGLLAVALLLRNGAPAVAIVAELPKAQPDVSAAEVIRNEGNFDGAKQMFDGAPIPAMDGETKVGNALGASRTMSGKGKDGRPLWVRWYATTIKRQLYLIRVEAHEHAETANKEWMRGAIGGFKWDDAASGVRGPFVAPFGSASEARGAGWLGFNEKKPFKHSTVSLTKPAQFGQLKFNAGDEPFKPWAFAAEARKPGALLFVGILHFDAKAFQQQKKEPEALIDDLENDWKNSIDDAKTRPKSDKTNHKADSLRGAKGSSYEFSGTKEGNPIFERGWVVKAGQNVMWVRTQFVGKDAEKAMNDDCEALLKSIKFE